MTYARPAALAAAGVLLTTLAACSGGDGKPELSALGGFVPQPLMEDMAAGYVTVRNDGDAADELTSVTTALAGKVTLHTTQDNTMKQVKQLDVPAGGELELARGGDHLMLEKLGRKPKVGEKVTLTLHFAKSQPIKVEVPVEPTTYRPPKKD